MNRPLVSLVAGVAGLALAGAGEAVLAAEHAGHGGLILYLSGILLFAVSAWRTPPAPSDLPVGEPSAQPDRLFRRITVAVGAAAAALLGLAGARLIYKGDLRSAVGLRLWLASLVTIAAIGLIARGGPGWPARWGSRFLPTGSRGRWFLVATLVGLFAVAAAARLGALKTIPFGINPDEGEQAVVSIGVVRGQNHPGIFEDGWYQLPMIYFWLLAQFMKVVGLGYVQARAFGALFGILTVVAVTWLGIRNFGRRVGLLAGGLLSLMGVSLQFARVTNVASQTAALWAISVALLLEGARRGKDWAWIGAGLAGGFSVYFYPTGRLWVLLATGFCLYLLAHGLGGLRRRILRGAALAALASILIVAPFLVLGLKRPVVLWNRAKETSIFTGNNVSRLGYYKPEWSLSRLLLEQTDRSIGMFNRLGTHGGFWPTGRPVLGHALATLTLLGLGWCCLRWRDPRFVALALWFWVGFVGVIVTIDTPDLLRMAAAIPVLALFPALVLDNLARRAEALMETRGAGVRRAGLWAPGAMVSLVVAWLMWREGRFYFVDYAKMDRWPATRVEADAVCALGGDTLVTSLGRDSHLVISGWNRLMALNTPLAGIPSPGSDLPLAVRADRNLAFLVYAQRPAYLPYLREVYPGGTVQPWYAPPRLPVVTTYRLSRQQWSAAQGALAWPAGGQPIRVDGIGSVPVGWSNYPGTMRWTAGLRVPRYWNYSFRIGPGPARLIIDGIAVLRVTAGTPAQVAAVALARGEHAIEYEGILTAEGQQPLFEWTALPEPASTTSGNLNWLPVRKEELTPTQGGPAGLLGIVQLADQPEQRRLDGALSTSSLSRQVTWSDRPFTARWTGILKAPVSGLYSMSLFAQGAADLKIDRETVIHTEVSSDEPAKGDVTLAAGSHSVELVFRVSRGPGGIEWLWTPPGGDPSVVPPSALSPPPGTTISRMVPMSALGGPEMQPVQSPFLTVP